MSNGQNGKGDTPRPFSVDQDTYANNWERVFGKKDDDTCAYSGLLNTSSYDSRSIEIQRLEMIGQLEQISQEYGLYELDNTP
jgi:hypothetical protein